MIQDDTDENEVQCDYCEEMVDKKDAQMKQYPDYGGETTHVYLCDDCEVSR